ncbi:hypothetical protein PR048_003971 [Dryococelus australis]|uniref:Uncharacterized protein n=1 Tax=Dryococelus australis TaxID=614101 RepID=A0ABQ9I648_9NEOP|nr:hypothetical protein PR048_003971 [Dryococelus australis]
MWKTTATQRPAALTNDLSVCRGAFCLYKHAVSYVSLGSRSHEAQAIQWRTRDRRLLSLTRLPSTAPEKGEDSIKHKWQILIHSLAEKGASGKGDSYEVCHRLYEQGYVLFSSCCEAATCVATPMKCVIDSMSKDMRCSLHAAKRRPVLATPMKCVLDSMSKDMRCSLHAAKRRPVLATPMKCVIDSMSKDMRCSLHAAKRRPVLATPMKCVIDSMSKDMRCSLHAAKRRPVLATPMKCVIDSMSKDMRCSLHAAKRRPVLATPMKCVLDSMSKDMRCSLHAAKRRPVLATPMKCVIDSMSKDMRCSLHAAKRRPVLATPMKCVIDSMSKDMCCSLHAAKRRPVLATPMKCVIDSMSKDMRCSLHAAKRRPVLATPMKCVIDSMSKDMRCSLHAAKRRPVLATPMKCVIDSMSKDMRCSLHAAKRRPVLATPMKCVIDSMSKDMRCSLHAAKRRPVLATPMKCVIDSMSKDMRCSLHAAKRRPVLATPMKCVIDSMSKDMRCSLHAAKRRPVLATPMKCVIDSMSKDMCCSLHAAKRRPVLATPMKCVIDSMSKDMRCSLHAAKRRPVLATPMKSVIDSMSKDMRCSLHAAKRRPVLATPMKCVLDSMSKDMRCSLHAAKRRPVLATPMKCVIDSMSKDMRCSLHAAKRRPVLATPMKCVIDSMSKDMRCSLHAAKRRPVLATPMKCVIDSMSKDMRCSLHAAKRRPVLATPMKCVIDSMSKDMCCSLHAAKRRPVLATPMKCVIDSMSKDMRCSLHAAKRRPVLATPMKSVIDSMSKDMRCSLHAAKRRPVLATPMKCVIDSMSKDMRCSLHAAKRRPVLATPMKCVIDSMSKDMRCSLHAAKRRPVLATPMKSVIDSMSKDMRCSLHAAKRRPVLATPMKCVIDSMSKDMRCSLHAAKRRPVLATPMKCVIHSMSKDMCCSLHAAKRRPVLATPMKCVIDSMSKDMRCYLHAAKRRPVLASPMKCVIDSMSKDMRCSLHAAKRRPVLVPLPIRIHSEDEAIVHESWHGRLFPNTLKCIIAGPSVSGKTCVLLSLQEEKNGHRFENEYLYSKSLPDNEAVVPPRDACQNVYMSTMPLPVRKKLAFQEYFRIGRHAFVDSVYLGKIYSRIPKQILRDNANVLVLFRMENMNLRHAYQHHANTDMTRGFDQFIAVCREGSSTGNPQDMSPIPPPTSLSAERVRLLGTRKTCHQYLQRHRCLPRGFDYWEPAKHVTNTSSYIAVCREGSSTRNPQDMSPIPPNTALSAKRVRLLGTRKTCHQYLQLHRCLPRGFDYWEPAKHVTNTSSYIAVCREGSSTRYPQDMSPIPPPTSLSAERVRLLGTRKTCHQYLLLHRCLPRGFVYWEPARHVTNTSSDIAVCREGSTTGNPQDMSPIPPPTSLSAERVRLLGTRKTCHQYLQLHRCLPRGFVYWEPARHVTNTSSYIAVCREGSTTGNPQNMSPIPPPTSLSAERVRLLGTRKTCHQYLLLHRCLPRRFVYWEPARHVTNTSSHIAVCREGSSTGNPQDMSPIPPATSLSAERVRLLGTRKTCHQYLLLHRCLPRGFDYWEPARHVTNTSSYIAVCREGSSTGNPQDMSPIPPATSLSAERVRLTGNPQDMSPIPPATSLSAERVRLLGTRKTCHQYLLLHRCLPRGFVYWEPAKHVTNTSSYFAVCREGSTTGNPQDMSPIPPPTSLSAERVPAKHVTNTSSYIAVCREGSSTRYPQDMSPIPPPTSLSAERVRLLGTRKTCHQYLQLHRCLPRGFDYWEPARHVTNTSLHRCLPRLFDYWEPARHVTNTSSYIAVCREGSTTGNPQDMSPISPATSLSAEIVRLLGTRKTCHQYLLLHRCLPRGFVYLEPARHVTNTSSYSAVCQEGSSTRYPQDMSPIPPATSLSAERVRLLGTRKTCHQYLLLHRCLPRGFVYWGPARHVTNTSSYIAVCREGSSTWNPQDMSPIPPPTALSAKRVRLLGTRKTCHQYLQLHRCLPRGFVYWGPARHVTNTSSYIAVCREGSSTRYPQDMSPIPPPTALSAKRVRLLGTRKTCHQYLQLHRCLPRGFVYWGPARHVTNTSSYIAVCREGSLLGTRKTCHQYLLLHRCLPRGFVYWEPARHVTNTSSYIAVCREGSSTGDPQDMSPIPPPTSLSAKRVRLLGTRKTCHQYLQLHRCLPRGFVYWEPARHVTNTSSYIAVCREGSSTGDPQDMSPIPPPTSLSAERVRLLGTRKTCHQYLLLHRCLPRGFVYWEPARHVTNTSSYIAVCREGSSTGDPQDMSPIPPPTSLSAERVRLLGTRKTSLNADEHKTPATNETKRGIEDAVGSEVDNKYIIDGDYDGSDNVEDYDDSLDLRTYFHNEFPSTNDVKKAEDAAHTDYMFTEDRNKLVDRPEYLLDFHKHGDFSNMKEVVSICEEVISDEVMNCFPLKTNRFLREKNVNMAAGTRQIHDTAPGSCTSSLYALLLTWPEKAALSTLL